MKKQIFDIIKDIYYRLSALPLMFLFWILIVVWKRRVEKNKYQLATNRLKLDSIWDLSSYLKGAKYHKQQIELKKLEKTYSRIEENAKKDEEYYEKRKDQFDHYLGKVFDPTIGK